jgi:hypothetical protein
MGLGTPFSAVILVSLGGDGSLREDDGALKASVK